MASPTPICVLISGNGSNLQALIDALQPSTAEGTNIPRIPGQIVLVISNLAKAYGLTRARDAGIPVHVHSWKDYKDQKDLEAAKDSYDADLARLVIHSKAKLVMCLGYMRILRPTFLSALGNAQVEVLNLHPALHGEYDGLLAIEKAHQDWKDGKITRTGVMIHKVIEQVDAGDVVLKQDIPFVAGEDEDLDHFEEKVHRVEHKLVVEAVRLTVAKFNESSEY